MRYGQVEGSLFWGLEPLAGTHSPTARKNAEQSHTACEHSQSPRLRSGSGLKQDAGSRGERDAGSESERQRTGVAEIASRIEPAIDRQAAKKVHRGLARGNQVHAVKYAKGGVVARRKCRRHPSRGGHTDVPSGRNALLWKNMYSNVGPMSVLPARLHAAPRHNRKVSPTLAAGPSSMDPVNVK